MVVAVASLCADNISANSMALGMDTHREEAVSIGKSDGAIVGRTVLNLFRVKHDVLRGMALEGSCPWCRVFKSLAGKRSTGGTGLYE